MTLTLLEGPGSVKKLYKLVSSYFDKSQLCILYTWTRSDVLCQFYFQQLYIQQNLCVSKQSIMLAFSWTQLNKVFQPDSYNH